VALRAPESSCRFTECTPLLNRTIPEIAPAATALPASAVLSIVGRCPSDGIVTKTVVELPADQPLGEIRNPTLTVTLYLPRAARLAAPTTRVALAVLSDFKVRHGGFTTAERPEVPDKETVELRSKCPHQAEPHCVVALNPFRLVIVMAACVVEPGTTVNDRGLTLIV
jgi:hypothetical protein